MKHSETVRGARIGGLTPLGIVAILTLLATACALFVNWGATAAAGTATASKKAGTTKPLVKITGTTQAAAIKSGSIKVRVKVPVPKKAKRKARRALGHQAQNVTLSLSVKQDYSPAFRVKPVRTKVKGFRTKTVTIKLPAVAKSLIADCGAPSLKLTAKGSKKRRLYPKWAKSAAGRLKKDPAPCAVPPDVDLSRADSCDFIQPTGNACMAPYPNDFYTRPDSTSETGLRVNVAPTATPANQDGKNIEVTDLNRSDGFSPGPLISVRIPGMDSQPAFDQSGIVPITRMSQYTEPGQAVVLIDAASGERQMIWGELDYNATSADTRNLIIRPGKNLKDGHRYIVAIRGMKRADGSAIEAPAGFRLYRDADRTDNETVEARRDHFESIFDTLAGAGIDRGSLYLAWDFTVASTENITGRMLSIRNRAFAELGDTNLTDGTVQGAAPDFTVNAVEDFQTAVGSGVENIRTVTGTFKVPCFLNTAGCPTGSTYNLDSDQMPIRIPGNEQTARFTCNIPRSAVNEVAPGDFEVDHKVRPSLYGHGLFGDYGEVNSKNIRQLGTENGVMVCGTDWSGMAEEDVIGAALPALLDLSKFSALPDRLQQGFLNFLFLGRLMIHPDGFNDDPAFKFGGESVIDTSDLFYYGNSQGGIAGGALTAVATDFTRSVLYVPGINYSTLLTRSVDFDDYKLVLYPSYPDELSRPVLFSIMQSLWDRGEPNGYANHMTDDPLPGTPPHKVMLEMAYGDHQVANVATEVEARTIGAPMRVPALDADRQPAGMVDPFYGHETLGDLAGPAADGNAFFTWDIGPKRMVGPTEFGTLPPPITNTPPPDDSGVDPHDTVIRNSPLIRKQIADFITTNGKVTNPCGANPCYAAGWNGFP
ncbi:MAG TPA: hypothetical protein VMF31_09740 [Solirubrobacterales bacterium]|nr:hypothetical protein [Solirubrobacterales bacterium]